MSRADEITIQQARAIVEAHEMDARSAYVHTWERLPSRVVFVTPGRGRESYNRVRPLVARLRELVQGGVQIEQLSTGGRPWTPTSIRALEWYLANLTWRGIARLVDVPVLTRHLGMSRGTHRSGVCTMSEKRVTHLQIVLQPNARLALERQAAAVGAVTPNTWAAQVLTTLAPLPPAAVLKLLGKAVELQETPKARVSDL